MKPPFPLHLFAAMLLLVGTSTPVSAAAFFTEDFSGSLNVNLQDPLTAYTISGGTIHKTTSASPVDRAYISTISGDYLSTNFVFEITLNSPFDASSYMFVGLGSGLGNSSYANEPQDSLFLRIHSPDLVGGDGDNRGRVDVATLTSTGPPVFTLVAQDFGRLGTNAGTHRIRLTKVADALTFALDKDYSGTFVSDMNYTVNNISTTAPFLNNANSHLFFGGARTSSSWDDLSIVPEPSRAALAALGLCGLILRRRRA